MKNVCLKDRATITDNITIGTAVSTKVQKFVR